MFHLIDFAARPGERKKKKKEGKESKASLRSRLSPDGGGGEDPWNAILPRLPFVSTCGFLSEELGQPGLSAGAGVGPSCVVGGVTAAEIGLFLLSSNRKYFY